MDNVVPSTEAMKKKKNKEAVLTVVKIKVSSDLLLFAIPHPIHTLTSPSY